MDGVSDRLTLAGYSGIGQRHVQNEIPWCTARFRWFRHVSAAWSSGLSQWR